MDTKVRHTGPPPVKWPGLWSFHVQLWSHLGQQLQQESFLELVGQLSYMTHSTDIRHGYRDLVVTEHLWPTTGLTWVLPNIPSVVMMCLMELCSSAWCHHWTVHLKIKKNNCIITAVTCSVQIYCLTTEFMTWPCYILQYDHLQDVNRK